LQLVCGAHTDLFPDSEIMPKSGDHVELLSLVERGLIDAALVTLPAEGMGLNMQPLAQDRLTFRRSKFANQRNYLISGSGVSWIFSVDEFLAFLLPSK
jgi:hypothetical protein